MRITGSRESRRTGELLHDVVVAAGSCPPADARLSGRDLAIADDGRVLLEWLGRRSVAGRARYDTKSN